MLFSAARPHCFAILYYTVWCVMYCSMYCVVCDVLYRMHFVVCDVLCRMYCVVSRLLTCTMPNFVSQPSPGNEKSNVRHEFEGTLCLSIDKLNQKDTKGLKHLHLLITFKWILLWRRDKFLSQWPKISHFRVDGKSPTRYEISHQPEEARTQVCESCESAIHMNSQNG